MSGKVYFIACKDPECRIKYPYMKIGWTSNLKKRLVGIQNGSPVELMVLGYINSKEPVVLEKYFHKMFDKNRVNGEWFKATQSMIDKIKIYNINECKLDDFFPIPEVKSESVEIASLKTEIEELRKTIEARDKVIRERGLEYYAPAKQYHSRNKEKAWNRFSKSCKHKGA